MLGVNRRPQADDKGHLEPLSVYGIAVMSIGFLVDTDQPMVWRGPIVTKATHAAVYVDTQWPDIDYLVIDMPPGTGDVQLTVAQKVPVTGSVIVTTPQALAVADACRGIMMFSKVSVPVLGVVENMASHRCAHCGHESAIFWCGRGAGHVRQVCSRAAGSLAVRWRYTCCLRCR